MFNRSIYFQDAIGAVDGTMIDLYKAPEYNRDVFATRKHNFSIGATGVCNHWGDFIYFTSAYLGPKHDSDSYKASHLFRARNEYFSGEDYLLADTAYALSETIIPQFKGTAVTQQ